MMYDDEDNVYIVSDNDEGYELDDEAERQPQAPRIRPPQNIPNRPSRRSDFNMLRRCLFGLGYMWLYNGGGFWASLTNVGRRSVRGYRWQRRRARWIYFEIDSSEIEYFVCTRRGRD